MVKKKQKVFRFEFVHDKINDKTMVLMWQGATIIETLHMEGVLSSEQKEAIREDYTKKHRE